MTSSQQSKQIEMFPIANFFRTNIITYLKCVHFLQQVATFRNTEVTQSLIMYYIESQLLVDGLQAVEKSTGYKRSYA
jgi:hypothetical protein